MAVSLNAFYKGNLFTTGITLPFASFVYRFKNSSWIISIHSNVKLQFF